MQRTRSLIAIATILFWVLVTMTVSGCSMFSTVEYKIKPAYMTINCPTPPNVRVISTAPVRPQAIKDIAGVYWVGLSPKDYENLSLNVQESIRFIKGQRGRIDYYQSCVVDFNKEIDELKRKAEN